MAFKFNKWKNSVEQLERSIISPQNLYHTWNMAFKFNNWKNSVEQLERSIISPQNLYHTICP